MTDLLSEDELAGLKALIEGAWNRSAPGHWTLSESDHLKADLCQAFAAHIDALKAERDGLKEILNTPHLVEFTQAVIIESGHQRLRWASTHDAGKAPEDWFWLLGYLGGKALHAAKNGDILKACHHCISSAAALSNWHAALLGNNKIMRPGIDPVERGINPAIAEVK